MGFSPRRVLNLTLSGDTLEKILAAFVVTYKYRSKASCVYLQSADAACGEVAFCDEHGEGVYFRTRLPRRRSKARDRPRCAAAGSICRNKWDNNLHFSCFKDKLNTIRIRQPKPKRRDTLNHGYAASRDRTLEDHRR